MTGYPDSYKQIITKEYVLEQMINEKVLLQKAEKENIKVSEQEVQSAIEELISKSSITEEDLAQNLKDGGYSIKDLKEYYNIQTIIQKLLEKDIFSDIEITDIQAKEFYQENKELYTAQKNQIRIRHILVDTEEAAEKALAELRKGKDFEKLAKDISVGPSAQYGGDLGIINKGELVQEFEEAAFNLNINQLSPIVQTQYGYHIIKRDPNTIPFEDVKEQIISALETEQQKVLLTEYLDDLKDKTDIKIESLALSKNDQERSTTTDDNCIESYGLSKDTIIFYHASWCPHCQNMIPIVEELQDEGYNPSLTVV